MQVASVIAVTILLGLSVFQVALIRGVPLGRYAWGGQHAVLPRRLRFGSAISIVLYALCSILILHTADTITVPGNQQLFTISTQIAALYFSLGIPLNAISRSKPERMVMTPLVTILAACFLYVAFS